MGNLVDTAIGLVLIFFLFSLLASAVQESLAAILNSRGRMLQSAIIQLLDGTRPNRLPAWTASGRSLFISSFVWIWQILAATFGNLRSDIAPGNLSQLVLRNGTLLGLYSDSRMPSYIPAERFADALLDELRQAAHDITLTLDGIRFAVSRLPSGPARDALEAILSKSGDVNSVRAAIGVWYSDVMDRVSGWYVRHVRFMLLLIGLTIAIGINADALYIGGKINSDDSLRELLVQTAQNTVNSAKSAAEADQKVAAIEEKIGKLGLPLGWPACNIWYAENPSDCTRGSPNATSSLERKLRAAAGWLLTAIAISLGAPFWFDLLQQFVALRGAGAKPDPAKPPPVLAQSTAVQTQAETPPLQDAGPLSDFEAKRLSIHDIRLIQSRLGVPQTGILDAETRAAVKNFQRSVGVTATGILSLGLANNIVRSAKME